MEPTPWAWIGPDQWCNPMRPVHATLPVVGLSGCTSCSIWSVVCSPAPLAAKSTPFATNAEDVQPLRRLHLRTSVGVPAESTVTWKPATPPCPVTNTHTDPVAGSVHTAPCERMLPIAENENSWSSPPVLPAVPLPERSARFSRRILLSLPGCTPRCGNFVDSVVGRISRPPLPMSWSDFTEADQLLGV